MPILEAKAHATLNEFNIGTQKAKEFIKKKKKQQIVQNFYFGFYREFSGVNEFHLVKMKIIALLNPHHGNQFNR